MNRSNVEFQFIFQTTNKILMSCFVVGTLLCWQYYYYLLLLLSSLLLLSRITNSQANLCFYKSLRLIKLYWQIFPRFIQFIFKWVDKLDMYDFLWELIPGFDCLEVEKIFLESSHAIFGCFTCQLEVVFSTVSRSELFR